MSKDVFDVWVPPVPLAVTMWGDAISNSTCVPIPDDITYGVSHFDVIYYAVTGRFDPRVCPFSKAVNAHPSRNVLRFNMIKSEISYGSKAKAEAYRV